MFNLWKAARRPDNQHLQPGHNKFHPVRIVTGGLVAAAAMVMAACTVTVPGTDEESAKHQNPVLGAQFSAFVYTLHHRVYVETEGCPSTVQMDGIFAEAFPLMPGSTGSSLEFREGIRTFLLPSREMLPGCLTPPQRTPVKFLDHVLETTVRSKNGRKFALIKQWSLTSGTGAGESGGQEIYLMEFSPAGAGLQFFSLPTPQSIQDDPRFADFPFTLEDMTFPDTPSLGEIQSDRDWLKKH